MGLRSVSPGASEDLLDPTSPGSLIPSGSEQQSRQLSRRLFRAGGRHANKPPVIASNCKTIQTRFTSPLSAPSTRAPVKPCLCIGTNRRLFVPGWGYLRRDRLSTFTQTLVQVQMRILHLHTQIKPSHRSWDMTRTTNQNKI